MRDFIIGASLSVLSILGLLVILAMAAPAVDYTPVGTVIVWAGDTQTVPTGWMLCNGKVLKRKQYPELFNAIGTAWGAPNSKKFNLPDLRGRFIRGADLGSGRDPDAEERYAASKGGNTSGVGSVQDYSFQNHSHDNSPHSHRYARFEIWGVQNDVTLPGFGEKTVIIDWDFPSFPTDEVKAVITGTKKYGTKAALKTGEETRPKNAASQLHHQGEVSYLHLAYSKSF